MIFEAFKYSVERDREMGTLIWRLEAKIWNELKKRVTTHTASVAVLKLSIRFQRLCSP